MRFQQRAHVTPRLQTGDRVRVVVRDADSRWERASDIDPSSPGDWQDMLQNTVQGDESASYVVLPAQIGGCLAGDSGFDHFLIGADMLLATARSAPFDIRVQYIAGGIYQDPWRAWNSPDGQFVRNYIAECEGAGLLPMFTYYEMAQTTGFDGPEEFGAMSPTLIHDYFADFQFLCTMIGSHRCLLHIEPDLLGYAQKRGAATTQTVPVNTAGFDNNLAGWSRRMLAIARTYAPNAKVGIHGSPWGSGIDIGSPISAGVDVRTEAQKSVVFLSSCGAQSYDYVVVEASDRDAGYNGRWWTPQLYDQAFLWTKTLTEGLLKPALWWQIPLGNAGTPLQDNRVDTFFSRSIDVAKTNAFGMVFGAGASGQTTPESDNGNFVRKMQTFTRQAICP